ncbi:metallophosphoesterase family protein [Enterococcus casseliflavus]|uniref:metallophosphoesterase family protein n=1 Tax=Enterococcus TaxID=1350 RepID=UPI000A37B2CE|nr:metallophosphoesterase family protein [Enterococcus sp. 4E1_DIV0656]OTO09203.1 hypothetical protein A5882_003533 [Enterococcus sp. 4E1_DIV0656]
MKNYYAISDVHGRLDLLEEAIKTVDLSKPENTLVLVGDYVDRGPNSLGVLQYIMSLKSNFPKQVITLMGNHDKMFLDFIFEGDTLGLENDWNLNTVKSFLSEHEYFEDISYFENNIYLKKDYSVVTNEIRDYIQQRFQSELAFLQSLDYYFESSNFIFVHAGVDFDLEDWRESNKFRMIWQRPSFREVNNTGKVLVVGHTPVSSFTKDKSNDIFEYSVGIGDSIFYIDGGAVLSNQLNVWIGREKEY